MTFPVVSLQNCSPIFKIELAKKMWILEAAAREIVVLKFLHFYVWKKGNGS